MTRQSVSVNTFAARTSVGLQGKESYRREDNNGVGNVSIIKRGHHTKTIFESCCNFITNFYCDGKLTHERRAYEAEKPFGKVDKVRDVLNQQIVCDDCRTIESEIVEMNKTMEYFQFDR